MAINRRIFVELLVLVAIIAIALDYQNLADQIALYTFTPSADIQPIIDQLQLTPHAQAVLYRAKPQLDDKVAFNADCNPDVGTLELGCYNHGRIYVLKIDNTSLAPEMTVVLGHELLHAVWAQTSKSEQAQLGDELESVYHNLDNMDLNQRMADYAKSEPGQETNELHSILGTEFTKLTPELEANYSEIFGDRTVLTKAQASYASVFTAQASTLAQQAAEIRTLKAQLTSVQAQMSAYETRGQVSAYNALVPRQNSLADTINNEVKSYNSGVDQYNALSKILDATQITPASN